MPEAGSDGEFLQSFCGVFAEFLRSFCRVFAEFNYESVLWLRKQQLQRPGALQERSVAPEAAVAASGSVAGALQGRSVAPEAAVAASGSVAGALWSKIS